MAAHPTFLDPDPAGGYAIKSEALRQCGARPTVTFPAAERHRPLTGSRLRCLVAGEQLCANNLFRGRPSTGSRSRDLLLASQTLPVMGW